MIDRGCAIWICLKRVECYVAKQTNLIRQSLHRNRRTQELTWKAVGSEMSVNRDTSSPYETREAVSFQLPPAMSPAPFKIRGAQSVFFGGCLYLGGGHTGNAVMDTIVLRYRLSSDTWEQLPPCPLKWFGMAVLNNQLLLVGGREVACKSYNCTNKIAVWDERNKNWEFSLPPMTFARLSPIAYGYKSQLIVGGGDRGSLDYSFEVFDPISKRWKVGPSLPAKCMHHTSAIVEERWFLIDQDKNCILSTDVQRLLHTTINQNTPLTATSVDLTRCNKHDLMKQRNNPLWTLNPRPYGKLVGMTTINGDLFLRVERDGNLIAYVQNSVSYWEMVSLQYHGDTVQLHELVAESTLT